MHGGDGSGTKLHEQGSLCPSQVNTITACIPLNSTQSDFEASCKKPKMPDPNEATRSQPRSGSRSPQYPQAAWLAAVSLAARCCNADRAFGGLL